MEIAGESARRGPTSSRLRTHLLQGAAGGILWPHDRHHPRPADVLARPIHAPRGPAVPGLRGGAGRELAAAAGMSPPRVEGPTRPSHEDQRARVLRDSLEAGKTGGGRAWLVVWRFHAGLFLRIPGLLFKSTNAMLSLGWVVVALIAFFNPDLAKRVGPWLLQDPNPWRGISRWWGFLPIAWLVVWWLMKANFEAHEAIRSELAPLKAARSEEWARAHKSLGDFITSTNLSNMAPINKRDQLTIAKDDLAAKLAAFNAAPSPEGAVDVKTASQAVLQIAEPILSKPSPAFQALYKSVMATIAEVQKKVGEKI
jgi:hypothetical protein